MGNTVVQWLPLGAGRLSVWPGLRLPPTPINMRPGISWKSKFSLTLGEWVVLCLTPRWTLKSRPLCFLHALPLTGSSFASFQLSPTLLSSLHVSFSISPSSPVQLSYLLPSPKCWHACFWNGFSLWKIPLVTSSDCKGQNSLAAGCRTYIW